MAPTGALAAEAVLVGWLAPLVVLAGLIIVVICVLRWGGRR